jgi:hypothetical protein
MEKPDFSSFYKFIVSIGLILVGFALILPWLFLKEPFNTDLKQTEIAEFTAVAQEIITIRQATGLWLLNHTVLFSVLAAVLGSVCVGLGLVFWHKRQRILDQKEDVELAKLRLEIQPMTAAQVSEKALDDLGIDRASPNMERSLAMHLKLLEDVREKAVRSRELLERYSLITNRQIQENRYDLIFRAKHRSAPDILLEIRNTDQKVKTEWMKKVIGKTILAKQHYVINTGREGQAIILVFAPADCFPQQEEGVYLELLNLGPLVDEFCLAFCPFDQAEQVVNRIFRTHF